MLLYFALVFLKDGCCKFPHGGMNQGLLLLPGAEKANVLVCKGKVRLCKEKNTMNL